MTSWYRIEMARCNHCEDEVVGKNNAEWRENNPDKVEKSGSIKREFVDEWSKDIHPPKVPCFVFEADCHGDGINLCEKHLRKILAELILYPKR